MITIPLNEDDLRRLVKVVAEANVAAGLADEQLQRLETTLDSELLALEQTP